MTITPGAHVSMTLNMQQGSPADVVRVTGVRELQDQNAQIYRPYTGAVLTGLPIQDLNLTQLSELMPGVSPPTPAGSSDPFSTYVLNPQQDRVWSANGQPIVANNALLDGAENDSPAQGLPLHNSAENSVQIMNLTTSNYDASQGRATGSILNDVTRTGSNGFHGTLFEYNSNDWLQVRSYFDPKGFPQSAFESNQFGATVGGAVVPDHTFFLFSYEGDFVKDEIPSFSTVPLPAFLSGNFSAVPAGVTIYNPYTGTASGFGRTAFAGNILPTGLMSPSALALASALPAPNYPGIVNNYFSNAPLSNDGSRVDARIDERLNDSNALFLRYGLSYYDTAQSAALPLGSGLDSRLRDNLGTFGYDHTFSPEVLTQVRLNFDRTSNPISPQGSVVNDAALFGITGGNGVLPYLNIGGATTLGVNPAYSPINVEYNYNATNTWSAQMGAHDIHFGFDWWHTRMDGFQSLAYGPQGGYDFSAAATMLPGTAMGPYSYVNALAAFLLGAPTQAGITSSAYLPSYNDNQFGAFVTDRMHWRRLTIDLGVRYDYFEPAQISANAADYSIYSAVSNSLVPVLTSGVNRYANVAANNLNFAPRIGLAYRISDHLVARAGYGMSYWNGMLPLEMSAFIPNMSTLQYGAAGSYAITPGVFGTLPTVPVGATAFNQTVDYVTTKLRTPYTEFYNFGVQGDLSHNFLAGVSYVGNVDRDLPYTQDINAGLPGTDLTGLPLAAAGTIAPIYQLGTGYSANYNSLQVNFTKRFSDGLAFTTAYTYSKAQDYGAGLTPFLNNINPLANYAVSNFDRTNVVTFTHDWRLPFGTGTKFLNSGVLGEVLGPWQLDGILTYGSGLPYTPVGSAAVCGCIGNTPTASPGATSIAAGYLGYTSPYLFGSSLFSEAAPGTLGVVGRNSVRGPSMTNYNLALSRQFVFMETRRLEFRAEAYNIANSIHWGMPFTNVTSANFGLTPFTASQYGPRTLQLALRLVF